MTAPHTDISIRGNDPGARHRRARASAVGLGVALVATAGIYAATHGFDRTAPDARLTPPSSRYVVPSERAARELDNTIRALYGPRPRHEPAPRRGR